MSTIPQAPDRPAPPAWDDTGLRSHQRLAARFATYARTDVCYVYGAGWHAWDGTRWAPDPRETHTSARLTDLLSLSWHEAMTDRDLAADVRASMSAGGSRGVLDLASRRMLVTDVDADPWLLNCQNGTLDLHTGTLRPHTPGDHITKVGGAAYHPDAHSDEWDRFLTEVLPDPGVRDYLQRYVGLALVGQVIEHVLGIATGTGRNGKGVATGTVGAMFGDYAVTASNELLTQGRDGHKSAGDLSAMMQLRGARWANMAETDQGAALAEATVKNLTGGDRITAKLMGRDFVEFAPSHTLLLQTNHLPAVAANSPAIWARLRVIPFDVSFAGREDTGLPDRLALQTDAVLSWAVEGLAKWQEHGLAAPPAVLARTSAYRADNDQVGRFVAERCTLDPNEHVMRSLLGSAYIEWCTTNREKAKPLQEFYTELLTMEGLGERKVKGSRQLTGLTLAEPDEQPTDTWHR